MFTLVKQDLATLVPVDGSAVHHRLLFVLVPAWRFVGEKCTSSK